MKLAELQEQLQKERRRVSFDAYDLSVRQILDMLEEGLIFVPPEYQRQPTANSQQGQVLNSSIRRYMPEFKT